MLRNRGSLQEPQPAPADSYRGHGDLMPAPRGTNSANKHVSIPGEGSGNPLQHSSLGNPTEGRAWRATVRGVARESDTT